MKTCSTCKNLVLVWGSHICPIKDMIISYPEHAGRFCNSYFNKEVIEDGKEKQKEKANSSS